MYEYNFSVIPYRTYTHVYSLPDNPVKSQAHTVFSEIAGDPYPNPASNLVHIPFQLPVNVSAGILVLYDLNGQRLLELPVEGSARTVILPTHHLVPGTYVYKVEAEGMQSIARKLIIQ